MLDLEQLYRRYAADVHRFAHFLSGDRAAADDITSETFLRAWSSSAPIREATVKGYLFTIARNVYLHDLRRVKRRDEMPADVASLAPSAAESAEQRSSLAHVLAALATLPETDRAALLMRAQDELAYDEIGRALGLSEGAVRVRIHRARLKLARLIPKELVPKEALP
jgi:RNA polymerase sigma-70 factor (ECF subfamily)